MLSCGSRRAPATLATSRARDRQHVVPFLVRACARRRRSPASTACGPSRARPSRTGCPSPPCAHPARRSASTTALKGATTRSSAVVSAATSSKSFIRSSQSQRLIRTPNRFSAVAQLAIAVVVLEIDPRDARAPRRCRAHSSRRVYSRRRSAVWIFERQTDADVRARTDRGEPLAPRARPAPDRARGTTRGRETRRASGGTSGSSFPAGIARSKSCIVSRRISSCVCAADLGVGKRAGEQRHEARCRTR